MDHEKSSGRVEKRCFAGKPRSPLHACAQQNPKKVMIMSTQTVEPYPSTAPSVADGLPAFRILGWWLKEVERIRGQLRRRPGLRDLVALNDRLLADIGITRKQADAARKAYWI
jgi:uncharacterized protein YjiS (DUF1127 family)